MEKKSLALMICIIEQIQPCIKVKRRMAVVQQFLESNLVFTILKNWCIT